MSLSLQQFTEDLALGLQAADEEGPTYRSYQPGIGPHAEDAALRLAVRKMGEVHPERYEEASPRSYPEASRKECDLVIPGQWAIEAKLARPFRDNGDESPHWIESVLYPYPDNKSMVGDCLKVGGSEFEERKAVVAIGYEHDPPEIEVDTTMDAFEAVAEEVQGVKLGPRRSHRIDGLTHPVHEQVIVYGWEVEPDPI